tara:strand:+ start:750 stop:878 length:129 start_codon:yes stop_codon:yes gene_type:complete
MEEWKRVEKRIQRKNRKKSKIFQKNLNKNPKSRTEKYLIDDN